MSWKRNDLNTYIWVFPVGRGNAAFVRTALNHGFVLDAGGGDLEQPMEFIEEHFAAKLEKYKGEGKQSRVIAQAVLSHPHQDHIASCGSLASGERLEPTLITCPHSKSDGEGPDERINWQRFESSDTLQTYKALWESRHLPLQTIAFEGRRTVPNLEYGIYYVRPPFCEVLHGSDDNKYGNATSIGLYYRHGDQSVLFPGDITPEAMSVLLADGDYVEKRFTKFSRAESEARPDWHKRTVDQPGLAAVLERGLTVLVAPHHGLESCFSKDLYRAIGGEKPDLVVLSERRKSAEGDGSTDERYHGEAGAHGLDVWSEGKSERRHSISTKQGDHIVIRFSGTGAPQVWMSKDPKKLLPYVGL